MPERRWTEAIARMGRRSESKTEAAASRKHADTRELSAEELRGEVARLRRAVDELSELNELSREIGASFSTQEIVDRIVRRSVHAVAAEQALITLVDRREQAVDNTLVRFIDASGNREQFHLQQSLLGWMVREQRPFLSNDPRADTRLECSHCPEDLRSVICVPLLVKSELIGVLSVCNKLDAAGFSAEDQRLLAIIAGQSAQVIENARLYEESQDLALVQEQLRLARQIQVGLLPKQAPLLTGYDIAGVSIPAETVGGDYYDFIPIDSRRWAIALGDVSGKGLPASLLMANLQATLRGQLIHDGEVAASLNRSNLLLHNSTAPEKFATLFCGILDLDEHVLSFSSAGHEYPFLFRHAEPLARLKTGGAMLGVFTDITYAEERVALAPGSQLVIISDGVTDALDANDECFGEARLLPVLQEAWHASATATVEAVVAAVQAHAGTVPPFDDLTIVVLKRN